MADPLWYFAIDEEERGPVTEAQLRSLIGTGNLARDDLVWKEGMEDWVPARQVPGLFDRDSAARPTEGSGLGSGERRMQPASQQPAKAASAAGATAAAAPAAGAPGASAPDREAQPAFALAHPLQLFRHVDSLGQPLLLVGFMLVLLARGCDSLATHYAQRLRAKEQLAKSRFKDEWDTAKVALEKRRRDLEREQPSDFQKRQSELLEKEAAKLEESKRAEQAELQQDRWRSLEVAARDADPVNQAWGFWRSCAFWLGTVAFSLGLWVVGFNGEPPERWLSLTMLAVIVYSLYTGVLH